ncbi:MAG: hypothetical protein QOE52_5485 [Mycobacterium sp.]|jgi:hypothetical protein|nr:hypothetical protein [Mycobacterium sp.]
MASSRASKNAFRSSFCAVAEKARATGDPGPVELVATLICAVSTDRRVRTPAHLQSSNWSTTKCAARCRPMRDFELEAAIVHVVPDEARGVELLPLYAERYVLLTPQQRGLKSVAATDV